MRPKKLCEQAKQMDMVGYLEWLGFLPKSMKGNDYWYLSPLRNEKSPSFKVNRTKNLWYDHGIGKGGTLVDFGILYYRCSVKEFLAKLEDEKGPHISFHPQNQKQAGEGEEDLWGGGKTKILDNREISDFGLRKYLQTRQIPLGIANQYCHEVSFELCGRKHMAIGFKNDLGGYELRNQHFKGSSSPKTPRLLPQSGSKELIVFEGFFSFLSFQTIQQKAIKKITDLPSLQASSLVLNSLSFFEKSRDRMETYNRIHLFLDRDPMGIKSTRQALEWSSKYLDESRFYKGFKDLNEYLVKSANQEIKQVQSKRIRF